MHSVWGKKTGLFIDSLIDIGKKWLDYHIMNHNFCISIEYVNHIQIGMKIS